ncbi:DNA-binding protein, excisionase family [Desulfosporosinus acidiphilus SJ4]|uniref:DNA-binding protein, excisionase family n=1 Tax=Desulfosporosinus acidiphilus (strain DSM 22704 / JCM 16185 / SJ4) TaxID=646529 RepID=I4D579_DESAJ|nr:helix-turn-helix domain-containing protein [Desulfosporosinus acidiphilus]AFM40953.1 DNA-binding protein, excisionase family [Desulfosporosinus acidiphilus SJ4]
MTISFYTVPEVATMLRSKTNYIYDLISQGKLKAIRLSERRTRISSDALAEFISSSGENVNNLSYNISKAQPPKRGRKPNGTIKK